MDWVLAAFAPAARKDFLQYRTYICITLIRLGPESHFGHKLLGIRLVCSRNGTAVLTPKMVEPKQWLVALAFTGGLRRIHGERSAVPTGRGSCCTSAAPLPPCVNHCNSDTDIASSLSRALIGAAAVPFFIFLDPSIFPQLKMSLLEERVGWVNTVGSDRHLYFSVVLPLGKKIKTILDFAGLRGGERTHLWQFSVGVAEGRREGVRTVLRTAPGEVRGSTYQWQCRISDIVLRVSDIMKCR